MAYIMEYIGIFENETRNKVEYQTGYIEWKIPDIFALIEDKKYRSPFFCMTDENSQWFLGLYLCSNSDFFRVDIRNTIKRKYSVEYCFTLKTCDGIVEDFRHGFVKGKFMCSQWENIIKKEVLLYRKAEFAPSDILTLTCTLKWRPEISYSPEPTVSVQERSLKLTRLDKLSANFKEFYADKETCDVTLKVQGNEFKAHKQVLMARSSVFAATFKHDTLERQTGIITISDCDPDSFEDFLKYLYSGEFEKLSFSCALSLYYTANKYDVDELKAFCVDYLKLSLAVEAVCEIAIFAEKYDETELFSAVQDCFNKNYKKILLISQWKHLLKNDLAIADKLLTGMANMDI